jgi:hypothetical protein
MDVCYQRSVQETGSDKMIPIRQALSAFKNRDIFNCDETSQHVDCQTRGRRRLESLFTFAAMLMALNICLRNILGL